MAKKTASAARKAAPAPKHAPAASHDDDKVFALLGTALPLLGYVVILLAKKNTPYATFYGKQGVILFIAGIIAEVANWLFSMMGAFGSVIGALVWALVIIAWVVGIVNALSGEVRDLPVIGVYAGKI